MKYNIKYYIQIVISFQVICKYCKAFSFLSLLTENFEFIKKLYTFIIANVPYLLLKQLFFQLFLFLEIIDSSPTRYFFIYILDEDSSNTYSTRLYIWCLLHK